MAPAYKVEELLALRDSVSESAVSLDKFADEDVIKEHVLRPSASAQLIGRSSDRSLRAFIPRKTSAEAPREVTPIVVPTVASTATLKRPSPSPSVKRGKAEQLLKEHGSPPGLRVTAGGRIVPGDLQPLGVRPNFNIYHSQALRAAPGSVMATQSQTVPNNAARIEFVGGQPIIMIGDRMFALPAVNSGSGSTPMAMTDEALTKQTNDNASLAGRATLAGLPFDSSGSTGQVPFAEVDIPTLKSQQAVKKQELRAVEQTEVLQSGHQTEAWRANMIQKKKSLIVELDSLRKHIAALESDPASANQQKAAAIPVGAMTTPGPLSSFVPSYQQPIAQPIHDYTAPDTYVPMMMYPPPFGPFTSFPSVDTAAFVPPVVNPLTQSPGSTNRRSRAIEIKAPHQESKKQASSTLDPKSPTYEPKHDSIQDAVPPTPSPNKRSPWLHQQSAQSDTQRSRTLSNKPSLSSVDTTDFFPTNTHEHSSTRVAPTTNAPRPIREEGGMASASPDKSWPASPWNEDMSSRPRNHEPAPKIGSWPEAYGKPHRTPLEQEGVKRLSEQARNRTAHAGSSLHTASSNTMLIQDHQQGIITEQMWPLNMPNAETHIPSTYQEGFQAGYDHFGMPDNTEVLQGYIQGLLSFLADSLDKRHSSTFGREPRTQTVDHRMPSLHGLVAASTPQDPAVSVAVNRTEGPVGSQENIRVMQSKDTMGSRRDSAYSPQATMHGAPASLPRGIEMMQESRHSEDPSPKYPNAIGRIPERVSKGHRSVSAYPGLECETGRPVQKGIASHSTVLAADKGFGQQSASVQLANRTNMHRQTLQRFYPAHKDVGPSEFGGRSMSAARPIANNRNPGLDGAMDDLADLVMETSVNDDGLPARHTVQPSGAALTRVDAEEAGASCFKAGGGKGKQKVASSPIKGSGSALDTMCSSRANTPGSPKKSGEHSPAKAKLDQVTNRFRRSKKDEGRGLSSEEKMKRSEKWRKRFDALKQTERGEIEAYREEESGRNGTGR